MNTENFWKIFNGDKSVMVLTYVSPEYANSDGVYRLMKKLQKVFGSDLCGYQKFDERFDRIEDFDRILKVNFNVWGTRLIYANLFEYDKDSDSVTIDRQTSRKIVVDHEFTYSFKKTILKCIGGWNGFRKHLCDWQNFSVNEFGFLGTSPIIETDKPNREVSELVNSLSA